ncbi:MAG: aminotransferase class IV, partial [Planctomycetales bacterium]|nr:aminotransferase class IV [Planctomycetales bacterium]
HGATAVERIRVYHDRLFQFDRHLDRWERTLAELGVAGIFGRQETRRQIDELFRQNQFWVQSHQQIGVLMLASPGIGNRPSFVIDLYPIDANLVSQRIHNGSPVVITSVQQPPSESWSRNIKVRCRLHYYLADRIARDVAPDAIGVLIDSDGTVTESGIANVLIVEQETIVSPPRDQILDGVSLQVTRDIAANLQIPWREERITTQRLRSADEVILTGTSCGIWFANSIDQRATRVAGPIYRQLRQGFDTLINELT